MKASGWSTLSGAVRGISPTPRTSEEAHSRLLEFVDVVRVIFFCRGAGLFGLEVPAAGRVYCPIVWSRPPPDGNDPELVVVGSATFALLAPWGCGGTPTDVIIPSVVEGLEPPCGKV